MDLRLLVAVAAPLLSALGPAADAQEDAPARTITPFALGCNLRQWTMEEGLPDNWVRDLAQTSDGAIWVATPRKLVRFNGEHFTDMLGDGPHVSYPELWSLLVALDGGVWAAGEFAVFRVDDDGVQAYGPEHGVTRGQKRLFRDRDGAVWLIGSDRQTMRACRWTGERFALQHESAADRFPRSVVQGADGTIWITCNDHRLFRMTSEDLEPTRSPTDVFGGLLPDRDGRVQLFGRLGLFCLDKDRRGEAQPHSGGPPPSHHLHEVVEDHRGTLWFGTYDQGLWVRRPDRTLARVAAPDQHIPLNCERLMLDSDGSLWVGGNGGLLQFRRGMFQLWPASPRDARLPAGGLAEDRHGNYWLVAEDQPAGPAARSLASRVP